MLSSPVLSWVLTALFAVTGVAALDRLVRPARPLPADGSGERVAELAHVLMSAAMVAMVWGRVGGPGSALSAAQILVFAVLAVALLLSATRRGREHGPTHDRMGTACHLLTTLAMVWMVAATPAAMGTGDMTGMGAARPAARAVDLVVVVALVLVAAWWGARARRLVPAGRAGRGGGGGRGPRDGFGAVCHLLMSLGMASMLLAMP